LQINESHNRIVAIKEKEWAAKNLSSEAIEIQKVEMLIIAQQFIFMSHLTWQGAAKRYPQMTNEIKERIAFELITIERMGYPGYFLIVADFIAEARRLGVAVGPGRGSAAGSAIAYCLWITNVDPIKFDLLFERFLNPDRVSMPDIDIDFDDEGRDAVIQYVIKKYGSNQVAQIITYGTMGGKSAIRDAARALDLPLPDADRLAKSFPDSLEAELKLLLKPGGIDQKYLDKIKDKREVVEQSHNFRKLAEEKTPEADVLKQAYELEGCLRNIGIHACGIIITPDDMVKFVPVTKAKDSEMLVTQFDNSVAENAGLLKMDFLGLRTLTIIKDALKYIKENHNIDIDIDAIQRQAQEAFEKAQENIGDGATQGDAMSFALDSGIFTPEESPAQKVALLKLETVLALIDGWTDEVTALAAGDRLPAIEQLRETLRRRRASSAPAQLLFSSMLGLQVSPKLTREASAFWKKIREIKSISERDQIWSGLLPTADDLLDPEKFVASTSIPDDLSGLSE
jgi:DNA polymerase III alpha subunit